MKDNSSKDQKESQDQSDSINVGSRTFETTDIEKAEDVSAIDVKEKLKKVTSMKKKGDGCCCTSNCEWGCSQEKREDIISCDSIVDNSIELVLKFSWTR